MQNPILKERAPSNIPKS